VRRLGVLLVVCATVVALAPSAEAGSREVDRLKARVAKLEATIARKDKRIADMRWTIRDRRLRVSELEAERDAALGQVNALTGQVTTLTQQRDGANAALAAAQSGVPAAVGTMSEAAIFTQVLPVIRNVFAGGSEDYTVSFYQSSGSTSYDFWRYTF
jgi:hypothetical protein